MDIEEEVPEVVKEAIKNGALVPVVVGLLALGAGLGIGYILGRRTKYEVIKLGDRGTGPLPPKVVIDADEFESEPMAEVRTEVINQIVEIPAEAMITVNEAVIQANIFAHAEVADDWDYDDEVKRRNPLQPYVIHRDEFFAEQMGVENYIQSQLTFYEGDEVLIDEDSKPMYNHEMIIGPLQWGHGSDDPNVFYARNMARQMEYEIIRDPGHYRVEVLGLEMEHQTTEREERKQARQRKFRQE